MSKSNKSNPAPVTSISVTDQLGAIEKSLAPNVSLTKKVRKQLEMRSASVPDALIQKMIQVASNNGGLVAGMPFDVAAASATLTYVSKSKAGADSSRSIAQKMDDDSVQQRVVVADRVFAIYRALGRLVKTPEGSSLQRTYEEMAAVKKRTRKSRAKPKTVASATPAIVTEPTPAPEPSPAPVAAPAPAAAAVPAASGTSHP